MAVAMAAKLAPHVPGLRNPPFIGIAGDVYEFIRDMALIIITVAAAYFANLFQKRAQFTQNLRDEWRHIVKMKTAVLAYCEKPYPSQDDYLAAYFKLSETIDNMRVVYRNVGETGDRIGYYPYEPLHDMRRALQTLDPRGNQKVTDSQKRMAVRAINQLFQALRERFLDELDLEEPDAPIVSVAARRLKLPGATTAVDRMLVAQERRYHGADGPCGEVELYLSDLRYREAAAEHAERHDAEAAATAGEAPAVKANARG